MLKYWFSILLGVLAPGCSEKSIEREDNAATTAKAPMTMAAQTDADKAEDRKSGAVGCMWMIAISLKAYGDTCHPQKTDINQAYGQSVEQMNIFMANNSSAELVDIKQSADSRYRYDMKKGARSKMCSGDVAMMYRDFSSNGAKGITDWADNVTAVPRPPVSNPCL